MQNRDIVHCSTIKAPSSSETQGGARIDHLELTITFEDELSYFDATFSEHAHDFDFYPFVQDKHDSKKHDTSTKNHFQKTVKCREKKTQQENS